jgi:hypothetical protein
MKRSQVEPDPTPKASPLQSAQGDRGSSDESAGEFLNEIFSSTRVPINREASTGEESRRSARRDRAGVVQTCCEIKAETRFGQLLPELHDVRVLPNLHLPAEGALCMTNPCTNSFPVKEIRPLAFATEVDWKSGNVRDRPS